MLPSAQPVQMVEPGRHAGRRKPDTKERYQPSGRRGAAAPAIEQLVVGRRVNDQASALVRQGRMAVYPSCHGQEACQVAAALCLAAGDWLFPTYRDTVAVMARGVRPGGGHDAAARRLAQRLRPARAQRRHPVHAAATQLLHAVGVAHAAKLRGEDTVVLALCGDGATSEGDFHEALNFAAVFHVPVVFFVQNNQYAISVPLIHQSVAPSLAHKADRLRHGRASGWTATTWPRCSPCWATRWTGRATAAARPGRGAHLPDAVAHQRRRRHPLPLRTMRSPSGWRGTRCCG